MISYYIRRSLSILRDRGPWYLCKQMIDFLLLHLPSLRIAVFRLFTFVNQFRAQWRYKSPANPYDSIIINTRDIEYKLKRSSGVRRPSIFGLGQIMPGDWEQSNHLVHIAETRKLGGLLQRFEQGKQWPETTYYDHHYNKYKGTDKHRAKGFESLEGYLTAIFSEYDKLYEQIDTHGYEEGHTGSRGRPGSHHPVRDRLEVLVAIGRDGTIYFWDGHHRFAIARALELRIPVQVVCRHERWQQVRDQVNQDGLSSADATLRDHPDLQDVRD